MTKHKTLNIEKYQQKNREVTKLIGKKKIVNDQIHVQLYWRNEKL